MNSTSLNLTCYKIAFFILLLSFSILSLNVAPVRSGENADSIAQSEEAISSAFKETLKAEEAGANTSKLIQELNEALMVLSEIKANLAKGDQKEAARLTCELIDITNNVKAKASFLKGSAEEYRNTMLTYSLMIPAFGVPPFIFVMIIVWRWFSRRYE